ncbi:MAG: Na+/H+ antiporter NhaA [Hyphomonadaceae bacterium]
MLRHFLESEAAGGLLLMGAAALALVVANSPAAPIYFEALHAKFAGLNIAHWVNDALMALFFLLVGLEIKRELGEGELRTWGQRALPGFAAAGGMAVPALIYLAIAGSDPAAAKGWAIPAATDIAFALGVLSLLGSRAPTSLKVLLTALAILDDLGAVLIIALFYTDGLALQPLAIALLILAALVALNLARVQHLAPYLILGAALWFFVLQSGVHATLAGVALAFAIPLRGKGENPAPLVTLEHALSPWVAFLVLPIFGFANAGVSLSGLQPSDLLSAPLLGAGLGLFLGKQIGVFAACWLAVRTGLGAKPEGASWTQLYGLALLCGVGFTMSLFINALAFAGATLQEEAKLGVIIGSLASGAAGWLVLRFTPARPAS